MKLNIIAALLALTYSLALWGQKQEAGVSEILANQRAATLSDVAYTLSFNIPKARSEAVSGSVEITLQMHGKTDLVLDFAGKALSDTARVNGRKVAVEWADEHIVVGRKHLRRGRNTIVLDFTSADAALNRREDFLYTLFVPDKARSAFPCIDQPDAKARFSLAVTLPADWQVVADASESLSAECEGKRRVEFEPTPKIPTYLFSFVAGRFSVEQQTRNGRTYRAFFRETDSAKIAQLSIVFNHVSESVDYMERYTGIPYPFAKYDFVILPHYQFGGMEHPGAVQLTEHEIFLGPAPTPQEQLTRFSLLAHETAHIWFGNLVTMRWFSDVWTKEVFANFFAAKITEGKFKDVDAQASFLKDYTARALATDRTTGTHPIQQPLQNLNTAGLLYGNIIYAKAPVVMNKLEELVGKACMQQALRNYLHTYAYGNATWDNLMEILQREAPALPIDAFSKAWVKTAGMPRIDYKVEDRKITFQESPYHDPPLHNPDEQPHWPQQFTLALLLPADSIVEISVNLSSPSRSIDLPDGTLALWPNYTGLGYGAFTYREADLRLLLDKLPQLPSESLRMAALINAQENWHLHRVADTVLLDAYLNLLKSETSAVVANACLTRANTIAFGANNSLRHAYERHLWNLSQHHPLKALRTQALRTLCSRVSLPALADSLYEIHITQSAKSLTEADYCTLALRLAMIQPWRADSLISAQESRLKNADRLLEFRFIAPAASSDTVVQNRIFDLLLTTQGRRVEPWAQKALQLLSADVREPLNNRFLLPALRLLPTVQREGDIFFPSKWLSALLSQHNSPEAKTIVKEFLENESASLSPALKRQFLQAAHPLLH